INYIVKTKRSILLDLYALRNVFAHADREKYIAEVKQIAFKEIENIIQLLDKPPTVGEVFRKKVYYVNLDEIVEIVVKEMKDKIYTHVPIYHEGKFWGVFSETTLLSWLVDNINEGQAQFYKKQVKDVNKKYLFNDTNIVDFIPTNKSIFEIPELFNKAITKNKRLGALLITEDGRKDSSPIGIITAWDLPVIDRYISKLDV
ncbi:CBS domain-containing protein, partial [Candidatus Roizmanbacteria bacterium]|nr:CBS domain-containing protein [Candidatus Roizmanbacteria bacterium]